MVLWILLLVGLVIVAAIGFIFFSIRTAILLAINGVIGFFALYAVQLVRPELVINAWSVLLTAILGIVGLLLVLIFHFIGIAF